MKSSIKCLVASEKEQGTFYGFIHSQDGGNDYYFTTSDILTPQKNTDLSGSEVEFDPIEQTGKRLAKNIRILNEPESPLDTDKLIENTINCIKSIKEINNPEQFEDSIPPLLKLLGIHSVFQFDRDRQAGKADGFFVIENLAVMYDCTLIEDFEKYKEDQIENYVNKLNQKSQITFDARRQDGGSAPKTIQITGKKRQVWIITKNTTKEIADYEGIKVKAVATKDIVTILSRRMKDISYDQDKLVSDLILLGN